MTLIEIVVATALIGLIIAGMLGVLIQNITLGQSADYAYVAMNLAKSRIERLREVRRDKGYADLINWQETDVIVNRNGVPDLQGDFKRTTIVNSAYAANLTMITVRVKYKSGGVFTGVQTELVTLISPYI